METRTSPGPLSDRIHARVVIAGVAFATLLACGLLGPLSSALRSYSAAMIAGGLVALGAATRRLSTQQLLAAAVLTGVVAWTPVAATAGCSLALLALVLAPRAWGTAAVLLLGSLVPALGHQLPWLVNLPETVAGWIGASWPEALGVPTASALGLVPLGLGLSVCVVAAWRGRTLAALAGLAALLALWAQHIVALQRMLLETDGHLTHILSGLPLLGSGVAILCGVLSGGLPRADVQRDVVARRPLAVALGLLGACVATLASWPALVSSDAPVRVTFLNEGGLDWERPEVGAFGAFSSGMFGLLPEFLEADGFACTAVGFDELSDTLDATDVLVVINNPRIWSDAQRAVVHEFLSDGGGVLVLGDHTDVFGLQAGLNSLLSPYGIRFLFDSAYAARNPWDVCARYAPTPFVLWRGREFDLAHGIGGSLDCDAAVQRQVVAYGFSDLGIRENVMGSFLGNYSYDVGEALGDVTLVAECAVGAGRLVVYGDTSAFQNGALSQTWDRHLLPLFRHVATPVGVAESPLAGVLGLVGLLAAAAFGARRCGPAAASTSLGWGLVAGLAACQWVALQGAPRAVVDETTVLIDESTEPMIGHYTAGMNSIGSLNTNLARGGLRALRGRRLAASTLERCRAVVLVAPRLRLTDTQVRDLLEFQEQGGVVLVVCGHEQRAGVQPLLDALGLGLRDTPLGSVPTASDAPSEALMPRLVDAWPIDVADGVEHTPLIHVGGHVVAVHRPWGDGGTILIADTRFFSKGNIEGTWGFWPGNELFVTQLFDAYLGAAPESVADVFVSPEKPQ